MMQKQSKETEEVMYSHMINIKKTLGMAKAAFIIDHSLKHFSNTINSEIATMKLEWNYRCPKAEKYHEYDNSMVWRVAKMRRMMKLGIVK